MSSHAIASPSSVSATDIERTIQSFARMPNGGLLMLPDSANIAHRDLLIALAAQHRLPAVYFARLFVTAGGLMSYGTGVFDVFRQAASYIDRILRGATPADLPVQAPTKYETIVNLKTAKALGLEVPPSLLVRADEVIEEAARADQITWRRRPLAFGRNGSAASAGTTSWRTHVLSGERGRSTRVGEKSMNRREARRLPFTSTILGRGVKARKRCERSLPTWTTNDQSKKCFGLRTITNVTQSERKNGWL